LDYDFLDLLPGFIVSRPGFDALKGREMYGCICMYSTCPYRRCYHTPSLVVAAVVVTTVAAPVERTVLRAKLPVVWPLPSSVFPASLWLRCGSLIDRKVSGRENGRGLAVRGPRDRRLDGRRPRRRGTRWEGRFATMFCVVAIVRLGRSRRNATIEKECAP